MQGHLGQVLYPVHILLTNLFAFSAVVKVVTRNSGSQGKENKPVPRGQLWPFVEPGWRDTRVLKHSFYARLWWLGLGERTVAAICAHRQREVARSWAGIPEIFTGNEPEIPRL